MRGVIFALICGIALGIGSMVLLTGKQNAPESFSAEIEAMRRQANKKEAVIESLKADLKKLRQQNELTERKLKKKEEAGITPEVAVVAANNDTKAENSAQNKEDDTAAAEFMESYRRQQIDIYQVRLNLTPFQEKQLLLAMEREFKNPTPKVGETFEDAMNAVLTSEQKKKYEQIKEEEKASQIEMMVTMELSQAGMGLGLSNEQKDKMYQALYQVQAAELDPEKMKERASNSEANDLLSYFRESNESKIQAVTGILAPKQLELYKKNLDRQLKTQEEAVKESGGMQTTFFSIPEH